ncbi:hypothetical protein ACHAPO_007267 [Fusarium lateritium]
MAKLRKGIKDQKAVIQKLRDNNEQARKRRRVSTRSPSPLGDNPFSSAERSVSPVVDVKRPPGEIDYNSQMGSQMRGFGGCEM